MVAALVSMYSINRRLTYSLIAAQSYSLILAVSSRVIETLALAHDPLH